MYDGDLTHAEVDALREKNLAEWRALCENGTDGWRAYPGWPAREQREESETRLCEAHVDGRTEVRELTILGDEFEHDLLADIGDELMNIAARLSALWEALDALANDDPLTALRAFGRPAESDGGE